MSLLGNSLEDAFATLLQDIRGLWIARFVFAANVGIQIYEFFITLDQEHRLMWPSRMNVYKLLYFFNRYVPFITTIYLVIAFNFIDASAVVFCRRSMIALTMLCTFQFTLAEYVLLFRAYAVWKQKAAVRVVSLLALLVSTALGYYYSFLYGTLAISVNVKLSSPGCIIDNRGSLTQGLIIILVAETYSLTLLTTKTISHYRQGSALVQTMLNDGLAYFTCIVALTVTNVVVNTTAESILHPVFLTLQGTLQNILSARLLVHIRVKHAMFVGGHENEVSMMIATHRQSMLPQATPRSWRGRRTEVLDFASNPNAHNASDARDDPTDSTMQEQTSSV